MRSINTASSSWTSAVRSSAFKRSPRRERSAASWSIPAFMLSHQRSSSIYPRGKFYDFGKQVFPSLQGAGERFYGFDARGAYWADIGTPSEYRRASYDVVRGVVKIPQTAPNGIDPSAKLENGVRIEGPVRIGAAVSDCRGRVNPRTERSRRSRTRRRRRAPRANDLLGGRDDRRARRASRHDRRQATTSSNRRAFLPARWSHSTTDPLSSRSPPWS